jgi:hypothetical protein
MRLLAKVKRMERAASAAAQGEERFSYARRPLGVLWRDSEERLPREVYSAMVPGEEIARDFWILDHCDGATLVRSAERVTRDALDLGNVFDADGTLIGRVRADDGKVITLDYARPVSAGGAAGEV